MLVIHLWRAHGGPRLIGGHASMVVSKPGPAPVKDVLDKVVSATEGTETAAVVTWFPDIHELPGLFATHQRRTVESPLEEWRIMQRRPREARDMKLGPQLEQELKSMQGTKTGDRMVKAFLETRFRPTTNIVRIPTLCDPDCFVGLCDAAILRWWPGFAKSTTEYQTIRRNCATVVGYGLLVGNAPYYADPPKLSALAWTPETVFHYGFEVLKGITGIAKDLDQATNTIKAEATKLELPGGLMSVETWKQISTVPMAHRYQVLKDIDFTLGAYHLEAAQSDSSNKEFHRQCRLVLLGNLLRLVGRQLRERAQSKRREAVLTLGLQILTEMRRLKKEQQSDVSLEIAAVKQKIDQHLQQERLERLRTNQQKIEERNHLRSNVRQQRNTQKGAFTREQLEKMMRMED